MLLSPVFAQEEGKPFKGYLYNDEYEVFLRINFYDKNIKIAGQELYGELPGYLGRKGHSFCWVMVEAEIEDEKKASMTLINDFGSEDLVCDLKYEGKGRYTLHRVSGSTLKIVVNKKWLKIPKTLEMKVRE